ncbi:MAG: DNA polymerase I [Actinomycetota bacterium]|nr:DNA polymerase I [Actinomycetota bacterium]
MDNVKKDKIVLIDGNNIAYRAFYALPDSISTSSGVITNAVLGFTNMLLKLIEEQKPDTVICAFDSKTPTFRHKMFDRYKIKRKKMPDELENQLPLIKEVLRVFNITCIERDGFEADDIIADIVSKIDNPSSEVIIVTGDKDMLQLVSDNVKVMSGRQGVTDTVTFDRAGVVEKFGVEPENIKDLLALMGDSSDNIPGVPGVGPKTAKLLLSKYGSVEEIYEKLEKIDNRRLKNILQENRNVAELSKKLASLKMINDINVEEIIASSFKNISIGRVRELFESLEFRNLVKKLHGMESKIDFKEDDGSGRAEAAGKIKKIKLRYVTGGNDVRNLSKDKDEKDFFITEFVPCGKFYGIVIYRGKEDAYFIGRDKLENGYAGVELKKLLEDDKNEISGFDFKNIYKIFKRNEITLEGKFIDYKMMYLILNPNKSSVDMDEIIYDLLNIDVKNMVSKDRNDTESRGNEQGLPAEADKKKQMELDFRKEGETKQEKIELELLLARLGFYKSVEDKLLKEIKNEQMEKLYNEVEEPLIKVLAEMEYTGINIDKKYLNDLIKEYDGAIKKLKEEIYKLCKEEFNINSSQQLSEILYRKLGLPVTKKTKTGFSTDAEALKNIYDSSPVIEKILDYREKAKLKNTYIDVLPKLIDNRDLRVHTTYNQLGTSTGRISSSSPNLQNIPARTEFGRQIRKAFIPGKGYDLIMSSDYSQIELRVLAHLSGDSNLIDIFKRDEDIHTRTASEIFGVDYEDVDRTLRQKAKAINFGIIYGMTEYGLAGRLSLSEQEARDYIKKYFDRFPAVRKYLKYLVDEAYKKGYSTTIFGRKRYIKELGSSNNRLRNLGERFAVNTPIQGSAADIMKISTVALYNKLKLEKIDCNIILHVHDELVLELKKKDEDTVKNIVIKSMEDCMNLKVRLKVTVKTGKNWYI